MLEQKWVKKISAHMRSYVHPGVEALGYVKSTTPPELASTSFFKVVFWPSWVSISPPNPSKVMVEPTEGGPLEAEDDPSPFALSLPVTAAFTLSTTFLTGLLFFFVGGGWEGSWCAFLLRNSTMLPIMWNEGALGGWDMLGLWVSHGTARCCAKGVEKCREEKLVTIMKLNQSRRRNMLAQRN